MGDPKTVATQFMQHYVSTFATNRPALAGLYNDQSTLAWEADQKKADEHKGSAAIVAKMSLLPAGTQLNPRSIDVQMAAPDAILVMATGQMLIGGEANPLQYAHTWQLKAIGPGQFYIHNEIFRLIYS
jgi:hypothetical protein